MKSFVLADLNKDFTITIGKKDFDLKEGFSYRFNFANKSNIKDVLKCLAKNKGLFRYIETDDYYNCIQTFSLAKDRAEVESKKISNSFKSNRKRLEKAINDDEVVAELQSLKEVEEEIELHKGEEFDPNLGSL